MSETSVEKKYYVVYGSLRKGFGNYKWCLENKSGVDFVKEEDIPGFDMYSLGGFPGINVGEGTIKGEIFSIENESIEDRLDNLEGYRKNSPESSMYIKEIVNTSIGPAYIYVYNGNLKSISQKVDSGDWKEFKTEKTIY